MQGPLEIRNNSAAQAPAVLVLSQAAQALLVPYSASKPAKEERKTNKTTLGDGWRQVEGQRERSTSELSDELSWTQLWKNAI